MNRTLDDTVTLRDAYLIMWTFAVRYWKRGQLRDILTDFITDIGPVSQDQTCDPAQTGDWLKSADDVLTNRPGWDSSKKEVDV